MRCFTEYDLEPRHLQGAALLDEQGHETPITDSMVEQALIRLLAEELVQRTRYHWLGSVASGREV